MTRALLDVNVLMALAWPEAQHHGLCIRWFGRHSAEGFATCSVTESGFVRLCMNPAAAPRVIAAEDALSLLGRWRELPGFQFLPADRPLSPAELPVKRLRGHRQVTDAVLLGLARRHGARLVTLDARVSALCPDDSWRSCLDVLAAA